MIILKVAPSPMVSLFVLLIGTMTMSSACLAAGVYVGVGA